MSITFIHELAFSVCAHLIHFIQHTFLRKYNSPLTKTYQCQTSLCLLFKSIGSVFFSFIIQHLLFKNYCKFHFTQFILYHDIL